MSTTSMTRTIGSPVLSGIAVRCRLPWSPPEKPVGHTSCGERTQIAGRLALDRAGIIEPHQLRRCAHRHDKARCRVICRVKHLPHGSGFRRQGAMGTALRGTSDQGHAGTRNQANGPMPSLVGASRVAPLVRLVNYARAQHAPCSPMWSLPCSHCPGLNSPQTAPLQRAAVWTMRSGPPVRHASKQPARLPKRSAPSTQPGRRTHRRVARA